MQVQTFYNGLNTITRQLVDASAGGTLNSKTHEGSLKLFEDMARNNYQWGNNRGKQKVAGLYEVDLMTTIVAKMDALSKHVARIKSASVPQFQYGVSSDDHGSFFEHQEQSKRATK